MPGLEQLPAIEEMLSETERLLRAAPASPAVRELRVRQGMLLRVVRGWLHIPPHDAQIAAMLECVLDLRASVMRACSGADPHGSAARRTSRPPVPRASGRPSQARTTRPPPRREPMTRTTRPPPRRGRSEPPPSGSET